MRAVVATVAQAGPTTALTGSREPAAIARARALAGARRRRGFKRRAKRCLDGGDEIAVHSQEPLARPAAVNLIAALSRGAIHEFCPPSKYRDCWPRLRPLARRMGYTRERGASPATLRAVDRQIKRRR